MNGSNTQILQNVINAMGPWWGTLEDFFILAGLIIVASSVMSAVHSGRQGLPVTKLSVFGFIAGILLTSLPAVMNSLSETLFQINGPSALTLNSSANGSGMYGLIVTFAFDVLQLVGLYAVVKSLFLFRDSAEDRSKTSPAVWHFLGGGFALNMHSTLESLAKTFGGVFQQAIMKIIGG